MTKETILERIDLLEKEFEQVKSNLLAYNGALQEARYWLSVIEKESLNASS